MFGDIYDIIVDKPKRGAAEVVGYENSGLVVLLDYGDGNIIKKLTAQGIINGTTWYPLKDFNQPTLDELRPTSGVGRLYGKVGFLKGTTNNGIFGIFDVEGIEIKALLEQPHHTALKVGVGTFSETRNPWVFEPPDEHVTSQEPVWLCPFQHADGSYKLASYGRMLYSGLDTFEWDGDSYGTPVSLPNKGYLFFDRFSTVLTEQDLQYEGGFANPSFVGTKYSELSGMFYEDFNFLDQVVNNYKSKLEHFYGTYVFSEGIGGFEYLLRFQPGPYAGDIKMGRPVEWFGTYVGRSFNLGYGDTQYAAAHMGSHYRARRLVFYDITTEKFHLIPGAGLPWIIRLEAPYSYIYSYYSNNQNYNAFLYNETFSYSHGLIKGVFVPNTVDIDVIGNTVSMSGETTWFSTPKDHYVGDAIDVDLSSYAPAIQTQINYLNLDQLPNGEIAMFDDTWEDVIDEIAVTPATYMATCSAWVRSESLGNVLYVASPSVKLEYRFPEIDPISRSSSLSSVYADTDFVNLSVQPTPFKPMYCISPPAEYLPMTDVEGNLYNIMQPDRIEGEVALAIPHIEWMSLYGEDETDKPKAIQTFLNPEQRASDEPNVEQIILDLSSIDLPVGGEKYKIRIYLKPGDTVMRCYERGLGFWGNSYPFYQYDQAWLGSDYYYGRVYSVMNFSDNKTYGSAAIFRAYDVYFPDGNLWSNKTPYYEPIDLPYGTTERPFDFDWCTEIWAFRGMVGDGTPVCAKSAGNALDEDILFEADTFGSAYIGVGSMTTSKKDAAIAAGYIELSGTPYVKLDKYVKTVEEIYYYNQDCGSIGSLYKTIYEADLIPCARPNIRIPVDAGDFFYCSSNGKWYAPAIQVKARRMTPYRYYETLDVASYYSIVGRAGGFVEQQYFYNVETAAKVSGWLNNDPIYLISSDNYCDIAGLPLPVFSFGSGETSVSPSSYDVHASIQSEVVGKVMAAFAPFTGAPAPSAVTGYLIEIISQSSWYDCPNRDENWYADIDGNYESPEIIDLYTVPVYLSGFKIEIKKSELHEPGEIIDIDLPTPISQTPSDTFEIDGKSLAVMSAPVKYAKISVRLPVLKTNKLMLMDDMNATVININKIGDSYRVVPWSEQHS